MCQTAVLSLGNLPAENGDSLRHGEGIERVNQTQGGSQGSRGDANLLDIVRCTMIVPTVAAKLRKHFTLTLRCSKSKTATPVVSLPVPLVVGTCKRDGNNRIRRSNCFPHPYLQ